MKIIAMDGLMARCEEKGLQRDVSLLMLQHEELKVQDYVVVHLGFAIETITPEEAQYTWKIFEEIDEKIASYEEHDACCIGRPGTRR